MMRGTMKIKLKMYLIRCRNTSSTVLISDLITLKLIKINVIFRESVRHWRR